MPRQLTIFYYDDIPTDVFDMREICFPGPFKHTDPNDSRSKHIVIKDGATIAAAGRVTIGKPGIINQWTNDVAALPENEYTADLSRCFVNPAYRKLELLRKVCLECVLYAHSLGIKQMAASFITHRQYIGDMLNGLGFISNGVKVNSPESNGLKNELFIGVCDMQIEKNDWADQDFFCITHLANNGFSFIKSDCYQSMETSVNINMVKFYLSFFMVLGMLHAFGQNSSGAVGNGGANFHCLPVKRTGVAYTYWVAYSKSEEVAYVSNVFALGKNPDPNYQNPDKMNALECFWNSIADFKGIRKVRTNHRLVMNGEYKSRQAAERDRVVSLNDYKMKHYDIKIVQLSTGIITNYFADSTNTSNKGTPLNN
jgi:hypothetical protein